MPGAIQEGRGVAVDDLSCCAERLRLSRHRRIIDDRSSTAVAGKIEIRQNVGAIEVQSGGVGSVGDRLNAVGIAVVNRTEIDAFKIDLI